MNKAVFWGVLLLLALPLETALAGDRAGGDDVRDLNKHIQGKILDYTDDHGQDNRIFSQALGEPRDMYVYLPPKFDPNRRYPIMIMMHGFSMDEHMFLFFVPVLDQAIAAGKLPPLIIAAPDGSLRGNPHILCPGTFFLNTQAGDYEDFIIQDVWDFMASHFPIRQEREAHVLAGFSMGGFAAYSLGIRHRDGFGVVAGFMPPLNLRWNDKNGNYFVNFDPYNWGWRNQINRREPTAHFGPITVRMKHMVDASFDSPQEALDTMMRNNPIELVDRTCLRNGDLAMYVAYSGKDEFNIDAQVDSFLYLAAHRHLAIAVDYFPDGHHNLPTAYKMFPNFIHWLAPLLAPYSEPLHCEVAACCGPDRKKGLISRFMAAKEASAAGQAGNDHSPQKPHSPCFSGLLAPPNASCFTGPFPAPHSACFPGLLPKARVPDANPCPPIPGSAPPVLSAPDTAPSATVLPLPSAAPPAAVLPAPEAAPWDVLPAPSVVPPVSVLPAPSAAVPAAPAPGSGGINAVGPFLPQPELPASPSGLR